uniref:Uncharacterized protein n=1 Tax=Meloidogyne floridensis TaxID=298350 RepID=A0A915PEK1_9BILA
MLPGPASTTPNIPEDEREALEEANAEEIEDMPGHSHRRIERNVSLDKEPEKTDRMRSVATYRTRFPLQNDQPDFQV